MRRAAVLVPAMLLAAGCGGGGDPDADPGARSTSEPLSGPVLIRTRIMVAATAGAEPVATGEVVDGSTLGGSPLCLGGTILDSHADLDPAVEPFGLLARKITCAEGTMTMGFHA
jgi:hypothetical protein